MRADPGAGPARRRPDLSALALALVTLLYPLIALMAVRTVGPVVVVGVLCLLLVVRTLFGFGKGMPLALVLAPMAVAVAMGAGLLIDRDLSVRLYPVFMNLAFLAAFGASLVRGPSMVERLARIAEPDLPEAGVRYTRKVTIAWCLFFVLNGAAALWTALFASMEVWTLYNGFLAYLLMGLLAGVEWLVRRRVRARQA